MSRVSAILDRETDRVYSIFGEDAIYTPRGGAGVPCVVVLDTDLSRFGDTADVAAATYAVAVRVSEVDEKPRRGDVFELQSGKFSGLEVTVTSLISSDEFEHRMAGA